MQTTTIQVNSRVRDLLRSFGRKGETYNEIIEKLIERARYVDFMQETYEILDTKTGWVKLDDI
jgi:hypothetical protein